MATMLKRVQICTTQRQVGSWMYNKEKNLCSSQNKTYFFQYIISNFYNINKNLQLFIWILHTNINMLCPLFTAFTHPNNNNGALFEQ